MAETDRFLAIYLNDHLAGATGGIELAKRSAGNNQANAFGRFLDPLVRELEEDRAALEGIMDRLGVPKSPVKRWVVWTAEKVGRLKLNGSLTSYSPLSRLEELETLALGVEGKLSLWRNLKQVQGRLKGVTEAELDRLIERAEDQHRRLEEHRQRAARIALDPRARRP